VNQVASIVYLARHGETLGLSRSTHGLTDLALTERGERNACASRTVARIEFCKVLPARCSVPGAL